MPPPVLVLAGVGTLAAAALGILVLVIIGIHRGDGRLFNAPETHSDAFARRVLTGVRFGGGNTEGEDQ